MKSKIKISVRKTKGGNVRIKIKNESIVLQPFYTRSLIKGLAMAIGQSVSLRSSRASYVFGGWLLGKQTRVGDIHSRLIHDKP